HPKSSVTSLPRACRPLPVTFISGCRSAYSESAAFSLRMVSRSVFTPKKPTLSTKLPWARPRIALPAPIMPATRSVKFLTKSGRRSAEPKSSDISIRSSARFLCWPESWRLRAASRAAATSDPRLRARRRSSSVMRLPSFLSARPSTPSGRPSPASRGRPRYCLVLESHRSNWLFSAGGISATSSVKHASPPWHTRRPTAETSTSRRRGLLCCPSQPAFTVFNHGNERSFKTKELRSPHHKARQERVLAGSSAQVAGDFQELIHVLLLGGSQAA